jgi:hypothetical protein
MSKFGGNDYILVVQDAGWGRVGKDKPEVNDASKNIITNSAAQYANAKMIPLFRRFSTRTSETTGGYGPNANQFFALNKFSLTRITEEDKLFIFAHGNGVGIAWMADDSSGSLADVENAGTLAKFLRRHGLTKVGLITFKSCLVGRNQFLKRFAVALAENGISAGWLKGYKGFAETVAQDDGGPTESIWKDKDQTKPVITGAGDDLANNARLRIVRGPGHLFEGKEFGRYKGVTTQDEDAGFAKSLAE